MSALFSALNGERTRLPSRRLAPDETWISPAVLPKTPSSEPIEVREASEERSQAALGDESISSWSPSLPLPSSIFYSESTKEQGDHVNLHVYALPEHIKMARKRLKQIQNRKEELRIFVKETFELGELL